MFAIRFEENFLFGDVVRLERVRGPILQRVGPRPGLPAVQRIGAEEIGFAHGEEDLYSYRAQELGIGGFHLGQQWLAFFRRTAAESVGDGVNLGQ